MSMIALPSRFACQSASASANDWPRPWMQKSAATGINTNTSGYFADFPANSDDIERLLPLGFRVGFGTEGAATDRANQAGHTYHYVAFGPHASTVNYRSIGTAADYSTGTITATNGSPNVTGAGTAWVANNRGRGDVLTVPVWDLTADTVQRLLGQLYEKMLNGRGETAL